MKIRTCPNCGHKYSFFHHVLKVVLKLSDSKWICENCKSELSFSISRRFVVSLIAFFPMVFSAIGANFIKDFGLSNATSWLLVILILLMWTIGVFSFETYTLIKKK
ncbi:hypothetical protein GCQ56_15480 [Marinifilum sp. N1E240]|uniref:hypothetical protein n=1 Tax=Marinifilum sp. N1E240 TaxID=2608082 RepID=UPI00128CCEEF|nr:hypothetical protein [Marinifilum sp. N1E240]MPQ48405.1 hypothetical protein [Marinifilum sp. N1E240]